jgi:hypothetical protein
MKGKIMVEGIAQLREVLEHMRGSKADTLLEAAISGWAQRISAFTRDKPKSPFVGDLDWLARTMLTAAHTHDRPSQGVLNIWANRLEAGIDLAARKQHELDTFFASTVSVRA